MPSAMSGLQAKVHQQVEHQWASRVRQERIKTSIEVEKERGLGHDLTGQRYVTQQKHWKAQTEGVRAQASHVGFQVAGVQLAQSRVGLDIERVRLGVAQDKLGHDRADRALTQMGQRAGLTIKAINVQALREQARHDTALKGGAAPYHLPRAGNPYALPAVGGMAQQGYRVQ